MQSMPKTDRNWWNFAVLGDVEFYPLLLHLGLGENEYHLTIHTITLVPSY